MHDLIVVGAGPAGLSAACHATRNGLDVVLFEKGEIGNTVYNYQRRKHVMAEPAMIPLRSDVPFQAGTREAILENWNAVAASVGLTTHRPEEVKEINHGNGAFTVVTSKGTYESRSVIVAIGIQGNPRRMNVPGETLPHVSSKLEDPAIYEDEDILMVGAGDAAIEGVLALCDKNRVSVVNRNSEFYRLKDALDREINQKVASGQVSVYHAAKVERIEEGWATLTLPDRQVRAKANLVFVRIGAELPRPFLEKIGVRFGSAEGSAPPVLDEHYQSSVPGLFLIGAAAGYHLIKQGLNQGHDVVEHLLGRPVVPVDEPILLHKLEAVSGSIDERLAFIASAAPLLRDVPKQTLRELILESTVHDVPSGTVIFREHDYSDSFYMILQGGVAVTFQAQAPGDEPIVVRGGEFFGEMSLFSGRRRSATVTAAEPSLLIESSRKAMLRLINAEPSVKREMDEVFMVRAFRHYLLPDADGAFLRQLAGRSQFSSFKTGEVVFREGEIGDAFYVVRSGSVKISKRVGRDREVVLNYTPAGRYFGEMALMDPVKPTRTATVTATKYTECIKVLKDDFDLILKQFPDFQARLRTERQKQLIRGQQVALREIAGGHVVDELMREGVFEGTDVLLIDENKCVRCDQCVAACAATHDGQTRLYRTEGLIFGHLLVPTSCRHCENPLCLTDCLAGDAILRDPKGEVFIRENCIGCGNCAKNCPYGNILMKHQPKRLSAWDRLLALVGLGSEAEADDGPAKAVKCDLCRSDPHGPACVRSCPTGAAFRVSPEEYFKQIGVGAL